MKNRTGKAAQLDPRFAGIILAGGKSTRMRRDKALLTVDGETMLARTARVVSTVVSEVVIVGRTALPPDVAGTPAISDRYGDAGPLGGIATGLAYLDADWALVVACDLPYLRAELLNLLVALAPGYDAVVPRVSSRGLRDGSAEGEHPFLRAHPTCAVFGRSCLPVIRGNLAQGRYRARDVLDGLQVRWVGDEEIRRVDPDGRSLLNVNTPDDWRELSRSHRAPLPRG